MVLAAVARRRHPGEGEQAQARERRDHSAAFDETRQGQTQAHQFRVDRAHAAHRDQADVHGKSPRRMKSAVATIRLVTGMKKRWRNDSRQAERKQTAGMARAPTRNIADASRGGWLSRR